MTHFSMQRLLPLTAVLCMALVSGCVSQSVKRVNSAPAEHAEREIPASQLLNVNIAVFDPNVPEDIEARKKQKIYPAVRETEARYMPYNLRRTLQDTGHWGAVRVVPEEIESSELLVTGKVLHSDGELLKLKVIAKDATGKVWLDKIYDHQAAGLSYTDAKAADNDPFQGLYNRVADDLLEARRKLSATDIVNIRRVSELRFAADLAPQSFDPYLAQSNGRFSVRGLPADSDPNVQRIARIRDRDYALIDALDQHYSLFQQQVDPAYDEWRAANYQETIKLRELEKQALSRKILGAVAVAAGIIGANESRKAGSTTGSIASTGAIVGGAVLIASGIEKGRESELHAEALEELGNSLESDVKPRIVELEGQTVTLTGSAEAQYEEWRRILREIYASETGFAASSGTDSRPQKKDL